MAKRKRPKKWMQAAAERMEEKGTKGEFSRKAKRAGMTTLQYAKHVLANKDRYSTKTVRQAVFAKNAIKVSRKKKKK